MPVIDERTGETVEILNKYPSLTHKEFIWRYQLKDVATLKENQSRFWR